MKPTTEYRVTCANVKTSGHKSHTWDCKDRSRAEKVLQGFEADEERLPEGHWRLNEYPYKIQTRTVTKWEDD